MQAGREGNVTEKVTCKGYIAYEGYREIPKRMFLMHS